MIAKQNRTYFEVRSSQRRLFDAEAYEKAFLADKPWPNPQEVAEYKKLKQLQSASRSWDERVPKTTRYNKVATENEKVGAEKAEAAGSSPKH